MPKFTNVRNEIEIVLYKDGRLLKHPSGVEVFEPLEQIEARAGVFDNQIVKLTEEKASAEKVAADCSVAKDSAPMEIKEK